MDTNSVLHIATQALIVTGKVAGPILLVTLVIGFSISLLQAATQVQEFTLSFVPKLIGIAIIIVVAGNWMLSQLVGFTHELFVSIPQLVG